jgi:predicted flap endonuclease-1-like 5' DNA nuclease
MSNIEDVEGIGPSYGEKLRTAGVSSTDELLKSGATPAGRKALAEASGISDTLVLRWVNQADLYRIKGIGSEYAELLEAAGVDTVPELAQRLPANLFAKLGEANQAKDLVRRLPTAAEVESWVAEAKTLPRLVQY